MRLADDNETKQMLMEGAVFPGDIMRDRKYERTRFHFTPRPQRPFRNRIVNLANCERVDVAAFVAQMESA